MADRLRSGSGRAPGKVILLGEHAVVYGRRAIAASIGQGLEVRLTEGRVPRLASPNGSGRLYEALARAARGFGIDGESLSIEVSSSLPQGVGLGSSAALSVALVRALADLLGAALDDGEAGARAFELEQVFHGNPSGIDNTVCAHGGLISFSRDRGFRPLACARPLPLVIAIGRAARETRRVVGALRERWQADRVRYEAVFDEIAALVERGEAALAAGDRRGFGAVMDANQDALARLGISTPELDEMAAFARAHGALGAKLTGGGGGGAVIALANGDASALAGAFQARGWRAFTSDIGPAASYSTYRSYPKQEPT